MIPRNELPSIDAVTRSQRRFPHSCLAWKDFDDQSLDWPCFALEASAGLKMEGIVFESQNRLPSSPTSLNDLLLLKFALLGIPS